MRKKNEFPAPVVLGGRKVGWPVEAIKAWLAARPTATGIYG
jgi:predicted DNA-binding transcriptional regulator AlpA